MTTERRVRTICRCDEDGKPAGQHSSDCPYMSALYAEAVQDALKPNPPSVGRPQPEGLCTRCSATRYCAEHKPDDPMDPIVLEPQGFSTERGWAECNEYVEKCGGLTYEDGEPNLRAAFGADPGICSCPACHRMYWAWGRVQRCRGCRFQYPTDWWPMYSYGVNAATAPERGAKVSIWNSDTLRSLHERRMESHAYYRYGYEHPVPDAWKEKDRIDWRAVFPQSSGVDGGASGDTHA